VSVYVWNKHFLANTLTCPEQLRIVKCDKLLLLLLLLLSIGTSSGYWMETYKRVRVTFGDSQVFPTEFTAK
jgi:hypothetical protein